MTSELKALLTYVRDTYPADATLLALVMALRGSGAQPLDGGTAPPPPPHS